MTGGQAPCYAHVIYTATASEQHTVRRSKAGFKDFFVTQGRGKSTDSVEGAVAQESIDSVERPTIHSADVQVLLIISFVHASPPQPSTAVRAYVLQGYSFFFAPTD